MKVTLDTNVFGPVSSPELYSDSPQLNALQKIRKEIENKNITPFLSEASLSLEGLAHADRIDVFIRVWATQEYPIALPQLPKTRIKVIENTLDLGFKFLRVPRVSIGSLYHVGDNDWARDELYDKEARINRYLDFASQYPKIGPKPLKDLGAELVAIHSLSTNDLDNISSLTLWPTAEELMWKQGILAEFDNSVKFDSQKKFTKHVREILAEWSDLDIIASHYSYGNDVLCTLDTAKGAGTTGILHPTQTKEQRLPRIMEFLSLVQKDYWRNWRAIHNKLMKLDPPTRASFAFWDAWNSNNY